MFNIVQFSLSCNMFYDNIMIIYMCYSYLANIYIYIFLTSFHPVDFQKRCEHTVSIIFMWHVRIRAVQDDAHLNQELFHSYVRTFFQPRLFLHVLLSGGVLDCLPYRYAMCFFLVFYCAIDFYMFASSWEQLLGHVCKTTDKQANPVQTLYIYIYCIYIYICIYVMHTSWGQ